MCGIFIKKNNEELCTAKQNMFLNKKKNIKYSLVKL